MDVSGPVDLDLEPAPNSEGDQTVDRTTAKHALLAVRIASVVLFVAMLTYHFRTMRMFRWEHSVTGGVLVTYCMVSIGLAMCAGITRCGGPVLQVYLGVIGFMMFFINSIYLAVRWSTAGEMTRVIAELLMTMGVPLSRTMKIKVTLSIVAAIMLLVDIILVLLLNPSMKIPNEKLKEFKSFF